MNNNISGYPSQIPNPQPNGMVPRPHFHMQNQHRNEPLLDEDGYDQPQLPPAYPGPSIGNGAAGGVRFNPSVNSVNVTSNPRSHHRQDRQERPDRENRDGADRDRHERHDRDKSSEHPGQVRESTRSTSKEKEAKAVPKMLKIAVVGDSTSGKTCLCRAVTQESYSFDKNYHLTCGVIVYAKSVKIPDQAEGLEERVNMALLDSSGQDVFLEHLPDYWDKLDGFALVVDLTSTQSLGNASQWLKLACGCVSKSKSQEGNGDASNKNPLAILLGNKMDLGDRRVISSQMAQEFASKNGLQYFECSVKESSGLEEPFFYLAHQWAASTTGEKDKENSKWN